MTQNTDTKCSNCMYDDPDMYTNQIDNTQKYCNAPQGYYNTNFPRCAIGYLTI